jgi:hypothetical protein
VIDVNGYCSNDKPILCNAIHAARVPLVALLLEHNATVSSEVSWPLHCAMIQMDAFKDSSILRPMTIQNVALFLMHCNVDNTCVRNVYKVIPTPKGKEYLTKMRWLIYHVNQEPWIKELKNDVPSFSSSVARTIASYMVDYHQIEEYPLLSHVPTSEQDRADMAEIVKMIPVSERINAALKKLKQ